MEQAAGPKDWLGVRGLALSFSTQIIQSDLNFSIRPGSIFGIMGRSGSGKTSLLKAMIGLQPPAAGTVLIHGEDYWANSESRRAELGRSFGVLFQSSALWSSMTIAENVALPLQLSSGLGAAATAALVHLKLCLVGLGEFADMMPAQLSGGMRKRAGLARALALDPDVLFLDEPSSGLDPIGSRRLDELILDLRDGLGVTIVLVSHDLASLLSICDDGVFLDGITRRAIAHGSPRELRDHCDHPSVRAFMMRRTEGARA